MSVQEQKKKILDIKVNQQDAAYYVYWRPTSNWFISYRVEGYLLPEIYLKYATSTLIPVDYAK